MHRSLSHGRPTGATGRVLSGVKLPFLCLFSPVVVFASLGATGAGKQRRNGRPLPAVKHEKDTRIRVESHPNRGDICRKDGTNQGMLSAATGASTGLVVGWSRTSVGSADAPKESPES